MTPPTTGSSVGPDGRYLLGEPLGEGGMGSVFAATDARLKRPVAVKLLRPELVGSDEAWQRLRREAQVMARLAHPGLPRVYCIDLDSRPPFIVQEFLDGRDLGVMLVKGQVLSAEQGRHLLREAAEALACLHGNGLLHRDIKPGNVFAERSGHYRLLDLGLARTVDATRLTAEGVLLGSVVFLPYEVIRGEPYTAAADIYGLGLVLHLALTGRHLHGTHTGVDSYLAHLMDEGWARQAVDEALPDDLADVIERCCELRPGDRFRDGAALVANLDATDRSRAPAPTGVAAATARARPRPGAPAAAAPPRRALIALLFAILAGLALALTISR